MKARFVVIFLFVFAPTIVLTWAVAAHDQATPTIDSPSSSIPYPVDVVLVLDASESMAYDAPSAYAYNGDETKGCGPADVGLDNINACILACNNSTSHPCYPFQQIKDAAKAFVDQLRPGTDRVAVVSYARNSSTAITLTTNFTDAKIAIDSMRANDHFPGETPGTPCSYINIPGLRWVCGSSNPGGALLRASQVFTSAPVVTDAHWVTLFLSSGGINATDPNPASSDPLIQQFGYCPPKNPADPLTRDNPPPCRDQRWSVHHVITDSWYDAEDFAYDWSTFLGTRPLGGNVDGRGVEIYAIGLGQKVVCTTGAIYDPGPPVICANWNPAYEDQDSHLPNTGELFLRYVGALGDDGDPSTDPCAGVLSGVQCGNYYFVPSGDRLLSATLDIANRILSPTLPTVAFSATPQAGLSPLTVTFTNESTGHFTSQVWDFGDTFTSTQSSPTHTYTTSGLFTVALRVNNPSGYDILTRTNFITVYTPVSADFSASPISGTRPLTVTFTNQSTGDVTESLWNFGDGITSTLFSPTHTYHLAGPYTVTLQVSGLSGTNVLTRENYITVYEPVSADFTATPISGTRPLTVTFTNQSIGDFDQVLWNFGDGVTNTMFNPTHTYDTSGSFTVTLTINGAGGTSTLTRTNYIRVYDPAIASFIATPISGVHPLTVTFTNQSTGDFDQALWGFGDGIASTTLNPTHTYNTSGSFTVTLAVNGLGGASSLTRENYITVYEPVSADFTATPISGTRPLTVTFTNQSTGDFTTSLWNFDDGVTSTISNPTHTYQVSGMYTVTLQVSGPGGASTRIREGYLSVLAPEWKFYLPLTTKSP